LAGFWRQCNSVQGKIGGIEYALDDVQRLDADLQATCDALRQAQLREELGGKLRAISQGSDSIRRDLEGIQAHARRLDDDEPNSPEVRMMKNQLQLLNRSFLNVVGQFSELRQQIQANFVRTFTRQCRVAGLAVTADEVQHIMDEHPEALGQNMFQLCGGLQVREVTAIYNQIAGRHQDIVNIERQLSEVLDLFVQFAILGAEQGRMIDSIEQNIAMAHEYVEKGLAALQKARRYQRKSGLLGLFT
jgi:syntaxin 1B/2/3